MNTKIKMRMLSILLCFVMLGMLPATTMARTVIPVEPDGGMNLRVDKTGKLLWDSVAGATGYNVDICKHPGDFLLTTDSVGAGETSYALFGKMDDLGYDNGTYRVKMNVSGSDPEYTYSTLLFYYDSPYEKLSAPANLRWNGNTAEWDAVPDADYYNVYIRNTTTTGSLSVRSNLTGTSVDLSYLSPQTGWYFEVIAYGAGYRNSAVSESPRKDGGSRTINPVSGNGAMNLKLLGSGMLLWDKYDDATSYTINIYEHPGNFVLKTINVDKANQYCELIDAMDKERYDNGDYRIEVRANGSSAEHPYDSMLIYYDSPYTKLTTPGNPHWNGLFASWDAVPGAQYYNVYVYDTTTGSLMVKSHVEETFVALTDFNPQPGWYFEVIAYGSGYRDSAAGTSPRKGFIIGADTYDASEDELYSGGKVKVETEAGSHDYDYIGESFEVSNNSEVAMTALPDDGYEFVEWRIGSETGESFSKAKSIGFRADKSMHLYAVFHKSFPEGTGTINNPVVCSTYEEMKYALEHPTVQGIVVNSFTNNPNQDFYTLQKEKDFKAGRCAITVPAGTTKYLAINTNIDIRVPYMDYLLYSFIDIRGSLTVGGTGSLNVSMNARGYPSAILFNNGTLEVGGSVTLDPSNKSFDSMHGYSIINAAGQTVINSGTFIGYATNAVAYQRGSMDIYGGTFKVKEGDDQAFGLNADSYLSVAEHNVNLYGGTFDGIRAEQSIGENIAKLPDLLGYGAYYTYTSNGSKFDPSGKLDTHETLTVKMNNIVRDVALTIDPPKQNGTPDQTVTCSDYAYKQATGNDDMWDDVDVYWEESSNGQSWTKMASNSTFTVGKHYRASVNVMCRKGSIFDIDAQIEPNVVATVNDYYAEVFRYPEVDPSELICVRFDFGILNDNIIEQIDIDGVIEPVVGEHPNYSCAISGTGYTVNTAYDNGTYAINGMCWYDVTFDMWMKPNMTFQIGHEYKVFVDVKTLDGYEFYTTSVGSSYPPEGWGYINGNYATLGMQYDARNEQSLSWTFTCQPKTVKSVAVIGLNVPMDGGKPDFTAVTDSDYYTVTNIEWTDYTNSTDMTAEDTFQEGHEYWLLLTVEPVEEDGNKLCKFVANNKTVAYLNGVEVKKVKNNAWQGVTSSVKKVSIFYTFKVGTGGVTVAGQVTSFGEATDTVTLQLIPEGFSEPAYETIVKGNTVAYSFANVASGTYTMKVIKNDHVTETAVISVWGADVEFNTTVYLFGDINTDGARNAADLTKLKKALLGTETVNSNEKVRYDIKTDDEINIIDLVRLKKIISD